MYKGNRVEVYWLCRDLSWEEWGLRPPDPRELKLFIRTHLDLVTWENLIVLNESVTLERVKFAGVRGVQPPARPTKKSGLYSFKQHIVFDVENNGMSG